MIGRDDDDDQFPQVGSRDWKRNRRKKCAEMEEQMEKADRWLWRSFYVAAAVTFLVWGTLFVLGVLSIMHFDQIIEFLQGFQY